MAQPPPYQKITTGRAAPPPLPVIPGFDGSSDEIDDEIREVFLEEFQEEIGNLEQLLPTWRKQPDNMEQLRPIRRVFHTLKGSGRLVGAKTLGEFSWKVENMLNRVLDRTRAPSHAVEVLLEQASLEQVEAFWDANDALYFGLRIEDAQSDHARVFVTDEIPEDEDVVPA